MKKTQIWLTVILFCISFFNTVIADEEPADIFSENIEKNTEINVRSLNIHLSKARIFIKNNKEDKALLEIEKILELDPTNATALEIKTQIIWEAMPEKEELINKENNSEKATVSTEEQIDYMQLAKDNWLILAILWGSSLAIIIILIITTTRKNKPENRYDDYNSNNKDKKDPFSELEDVF